MAHNDNTPNNQTGNFNLRSIDEVLNSPIQEQSILDSEGISLQFGGYEND